MKIYPYKHHQLLVEKLNRLMESLPSQTKELIEEAIEATKPDPYYSKSDDQSRYYIVRAYDKAPYGAIMRMGVPTVGGMKNTLFIGGTKGWKYHHEAQSYLDLYNESRASMKLEDEKVWVLVCSLENTFENVEPIDFPVGVYTNKNDTEDAMKKMALHEEEIREAQGAIYNVEFLIYSFPLNTPLDVVLSECGVINSDDTK